MLRPRCVLLPPRIPHHHHVPNRRRTLLTLAIESSCDDTAVAVLSRTPNHAELLFNERVSSDNRAFKGVHPVVTVQGHNASLAALVQKALLALPAPPNESSSSPSIAVSSGASTVQKQRPDFVSVTRGPGIMANLAVGLNMAKGLAVAWNVPLLGVHHMQAHALTPRLVDALETEKSSSAREPAFPFLTLLVSGGHTQLVHSAGLTEHQIVATTGDIAIGNLLDQTARAILPADVLESSPDVMYGRLLESFAFDGDEAYESFYEPPLSRQDEMTPVETPYSWTIALPFRNSRRLAYSFSSIHTVVHRIAEQNPNMGITERKCLARHTMRAAFQHLSSRLILALQDHPHLQSAAHTLVVSGGVACNKFLRHVLKETLAARGFPDVRIVAPPVELCTDNAAMIAWTGMEMFEEGWRSDVGVRPVGRWPMSVEGEDGILGMDGWVGRDRW